MRHGDYFSFPLDEKEDYPLAIDMAGIDFCHENYRIYRKNSVITVIGYVLEGSGAIHQGSNIFYPKKGDIFIVPKNIDHDYYVFKSNPWEFLWFNVRGDLTLKLLNDYQLDNMCVVEDCNVRHLFEKGFELAASKSEDIDLIQRTISLLIIEIIMEVAAVIKKRKIHYSPDVMRIKNYLDSHIEDQVCLEDISRLVCLSSRQINRIFKKEMGRTPYNYLLTKKIELAKKYLLNTNLIIKQIAYRLNFADAYYFSNVFRQKTGVSPLNYKKANSYTM